MTFRIREGRQLLDTSEATADNYVLVELDDGSEVYLVTREVYQALFPAATIYIDRNDLYVDPDRTNTLIMRTLADYYQRDMLLRGRRDRRDFEKWRRNSSPDWEKKLTMHVNFIGDSDWNPVPSRGSVLRIIVGHQRGGIEIRLHSSVKSTIIH